MKKSDLLEAYERYAYSAGFGDEWIADIGEGFKFFIQFCEESGTEPTVPRFMRWIENRIADKKHAAVAKEMAKEVAHE